MARLREALTLFRIAVGVYVRVGKYWLDEETIEKLLEKQWWNGCEEEIKKVREMEFRMEDYVKL